jgi:hypothetical protein
MKIVFKYFISVYLALFVNIFISNYLALCISVYLTLLFLSQSLKIYVTCIFFIHCLHITFFN